MASIRQEIQVAAPAEKIWDAVRDVGRSTVGWCRASSPTARLDGDARIVTFGNGVVAREVIVDLDDAARRACWSASGGRLTHHNASLQVFAEDAGHSRLVWIADLLPHEMAEPIAGMIAAGMQAMKKTLEA